MQAYSYQSAFFCVDCANKIKPCKADPEIPQGPFPDGGGASDRPEHCDACKTFLENPLTKDGERYVIKHCTGAPSGSVANRIWRPFYSYLFDGKIELHTCGNCCAAWPHESLNIAKHISERVDAGGPAPSGECPGCGALCYEESFAAEAFAPLNGLPAGAVSNTLAAALQFYIDNGQGDPDQRSETIHELACGHVKGLREDVSLNDDACRALLAALLTGKKA